MQITPHIHAIKTPLGPAPDRFVHVYLIYGESITLIDTGFNGSEKLITEDIRSSGRDLSEIGLTVLTHSHPDHTGSAKAIRELTGCTVGAHPLDRSAIENVDPALLQNPAPGVPPLVGGPVRVGRLLNDGDTIRAGRGLTLEVLHTPGHSPGSISLLLRGEMALFTGDAVQAPGRVPVFADPSALVRSVQRLKGIPGIAHYLPGHDMPATGDAAYQRLEDSLAHLRRFHAAAKRAASETCGTPDPQDLARRVLSILGIPPTAPMQFVVKSVLADLNATGLDDLLGE